MSKLVLLRHGESEWNKKNVFTGWVDIPLSLNGVEEAFRAGEKISDIAFDIIFTSSLVRAMETTMLCMLKNKNSKIPVVIHNEGKQKEWAKIYSDEMQKETIPVFSDWHLNERYYGELQGLNKTATAEKYGAEQVHIWRRSYDVPPPNGECLKDTATRTIPYFKEHIFPLLQQNKNVLIVAHGNSLRSIVMHLDKLTPNEILKFELATGDPVIYDFQDGKFSKYANR